MKSLRVVGLLFGVGLLLLGSVSCGYVVGVERGGKGDPQTTTGNSGADKGTVTEEDVEGGTVTETVFATNDEVLFLGETEGDTGLSSGSYRVRLRMSQEVMGGGFSSDSYTVLLNAPPPFE